jgi:ABC-type nitrate/sulfonate/bicarbonate transport system permease component
MADAVRLSAARPRALSPVLLPRAVAIVAILALWQVASSSGLFFRDVVPSLASVAAALIGLLGEAQLYRHLGVTVGELAGAVVLGAAAGLAVGLVLGANRFLARAYEPFLHYLGPTPKIIFFPVMIMWFGVGLGSKTAMGAISCFFPVALSVAAGMRGIDAVLVKVGRSFGASTRQMVTKIYLPALRAPLLNGLRLGFGVAVIGVLLAETKLSNQGIGFLVIQAYTKFDMPRMYSLLLVIFVFAGAMNALGTKLGRREKEIGR